MDVRHAVSPAGGEVVHLANPFFALILSDRQQEARRGGARLAVIAFALSFLVWPALHEGVSLREAPAVEFFAILEVLPATGGGLTGLALDKLDLRIWWFLAAGVVAVGLLAIGPPQ